MSTNQPNNQSNLNRNQKSKRNNNNRSNNRRIRNRRRQTKRNRGRSWIYPVPVAYASRSSVISNLSTRNGKTYLEFSEAFPVTRHAADLFDFILPMTPTKWTGTRTAAITSTYSDARPVSISFHFYPSVSTSVSGSYAVGTYFAGNSVRIDTRLAAMSALPATNGGFMQTIWRPGSARVGLGSNLRANNFPMADLCEDDIPFWVVITSAIESNITNLGTLVIRGKLHLHNPITRTEQIPSGNNISLAIQDRPDHQGQKMLIALRDSLVIPTQIGKDYFFTAASNLLNTNGEILSRALQFFKAQLFETTQTQYHFSVDPLFANIINKLGTFIGRVPENF